MEHSTAATPAARLAATIQWLFSPFKLHFWLKPKMVYTFKTILVDAF